MDILALWFGWALVWGVGAAVVALLYRRRAEEDGAGLLAFVVGSGWFAGQFLLTVWMRALSAAGVAFGVAAIAVPLVAVGVPIGWIAWRRRGDAARGAVLPLRALLANDLAPGSRLLWLAILAWLALRFALLLTEVVRRPLYPWDAWTQWATKARVWYELRRIVPFGPLSEWLAAPAGSVYYDAAPHYPATVPLTQVWSATLLGRWDDALINLPWWITALAFGFALYGWLRRERMEPLAALIAAWLALSLPILDAHVALAGYADLAMATYFTLTALCALRFARTRDARDLVLAIVLGAACVVIKNPGKIWLAMLVPGLVAAWLPRHGLRFAAACFAVAAIVALVLSRSGVTLLGYHLQLDFDMPWNGLAQAYFAFANWHLLFYGALAVVVLARRRLLAPDLAPLTITVAAGLAFLMFGFGFTNARVWVEDQSTVNRATLHVAPLIVVWMVSAFHAWSRAEPQASSAGGAAVASGR
jgi:hypothetical protein